MKTEEKILKYMDGTLSESESGELLHSLSVSPEKRVVLEQHIKLRELTSLAQKPAAVPQAIEAMMAERFPAIASYNREIAGGAMLGAEAAKQSFLGKMAASVASFVGQYPIRTGFAVAAASVIGYFAFRSNDQKSSLAGMTDKTVVTNVTSSNTGADLQKENSISTSANNSANSHSATSANAVSVPAKNSAEAQTNSVSHRSISSNTNHGGSRLQNNGSTDQMSLKKDLKNITTTDNSNSQKITLPSKAAKDIERQSRINERNAKIAHNNSKDVSTAFADVKNQETSSADRIPELAMIAPVKDFPSDPVLIAPQNNIGNRVQQNPFRAREENSGGLPIALRLSGSLGTSLVNVSQNSNSFSGLAENSFQGGIDYIFDPYFSVGIEGGQASISHLVTQSSVQSDAAGSPSISRVVVNNSVSNASQLYGRAVVRYTFNPYDLVRMEGSVGIGAALTSVTSPLVSGMFALGTDIYEHIGVSLGLSFVGAWTKADMQAQTEPAPSSDPIGYVTVNHATPTLFTPSVSIRAGISIKPW